jgi:predicted DNA-binding transcriptional regulator AlpA
MVGKRLDASTEVLQVVPMGEQPTRTKHGLPQYVGEKEVLAATGMSRATLSRYRHAGTFPQPVKMGTNKWRLDDVLTWMEQRHRSERQKLAQLAVAHSAKLPDDDIRQAAFDLAAEHFSRLIGEQVTPSDIAFGRPPSSLEEFLDALHIHFEKLTDTQCLAVAYYLFPAFRPMLDDAFTKNGLVWPRDPQRWREMAAGALAAAGERTDLH